MASEYSGGRVSGKLESIGQCVGSIKAVRKLLFDVLDVDEQVISIHEGWFQDTLPRVQRTIGPISILRLDGDWHESTRICLDSLYPKVVSGGYVIIDDYGHWSGCRDAVHEYMARIKVDHTLIPIDYTGIYFTK